MSSNSIEKWDLGIANRAVKMYPNKFISTIVIGERGYGKTTYSLKNMAQIFNRLDGLPIDKAYEKAFDYIIFTPEDLDKRVDYNLKHDIVDPVWLIDDAAVHFSSYLQWIDITEAALISGTFDTIREVVSCLILTCPNKKRLFSALRDYDQYNVIIYQEPPAYGYERRAIGINWFPIPDGRKRFKKRFSDLFSCYIDNFYYDRYKKLRRDFIIDIRERLKKLKDERLREKKSHKSRTDYLIKKYSNVVEQKNKKNDADNDFTEDELNKIYDLSIEKEDDEGEDII